jgi:hypothetical protein
MPDGVKDAFEKIKNIWNGLKEFFTGLWEAIKQGPSAVFDYLKNAFFGLFDSIKERFIGFINKIKEGWETVKGFFGAVVDGTKNIGSKIGETVSGVFGGGNNNKNNAFPAHAAGGIFTQPHVAEIAEKGAEAVVPLNNTSHGFDIWKQAGDLGGYLKTASEQSPAVSAAASVAAAPPPVKTPEPSPVMAAASQKISSGNTTVNVEFKMTNNFSGGTPDSTTASQISEAGQKAGEDFETKVKAALENILSNQRRVSYA